jgi:hypothetical protein
MSLRRTAVTPPATRAREVAVPEIALYEDMTALDAVGPDEVLTRLPEAEVKFVVPELGTPDYPSPMAAA